MKSQQHDRKFNHGSPDFPGNDEMKTLRKYTIINRLDKVEEIWGTKDKL